MTPPIALTRPTRPRCCIAVLSLILLMQPGAGVAQAQTSVAQFLAPGAAGDQFGNSVAISGDTLVIGVAFDDTAGGVDAGAAIVFARAGGVWSQQAVLTPAAGAADDYFGFSVAVSGDTIVVGAALDDTPAGANAGSATVFTRTAGVWSQQAVLTHPAGAANDLFGFSVAISGDTIAIGANQDDTAAGSNAGSATVFTRTGGIWTAQALLTHAAGTALDEFGNSLAISGDTLVVGARSDDTPAGSNAGSATVFTRTDGVWTEQTLLTHVAGAADDRFGWSVAISGDTIVVGANQDDTAAGPNAGSATVFTRTAGVWTDQAFLTHAAGAADDQFGISVAVSGEVLVVGANGDDTTAGGAAGSATVFTRSAGVWTDRGLLGHVAGAEGDLFGFSVTVGGDTLVVGANGDDTAAGLDAGSATVFLVEADADGDGVGDRLDFCPTTAAGADVTDMGCSVADLTGPVGPVGPVGPAGLPGPAGLNGLDGATGPMGPQGPAGPVGPAGPQGVAGQDGISILGVPEPAGANCPTGGVKVTPIFIDGSAAGASQFVCHGQLGPIGATGANGLNGRDGEVGPQGPIGPQGPAGADGSVGPQGPQGPPGPAGANGLNGANGAAGPQGPAGPAGPSGADGATGPAGPAGTNGRDGAAGPQGPPGPTGADGPVGPPGPPGPAGADGTPGPQGPAGAQGPAGPAGTNGLNGGPGPAGPGAGFELRRVDSNTTITLPSNGKSVIYLVTTNRTNVTITLPPAAAAAGKFLIIKRVDRGRSVLITPQGTDTIEASRRALRMENQRDSLTFVTDGTEWVLMSLID